MTTDLDPAYTTFIIERAKLAERLSEIQGSVDRTNYPSYGGEQELAELKSMFAAVGTVHDVLLNKAWFSVAQAESCSASLSAVETALVQTTHSLSINMTLSNLALFAKTVLRFKSNETASGYSNAVVQLN